MVVDTFETEILEYVKEIHEIVSSKKDESKIDLKRINIIIVTIVGISRVYEYPEIETLLLGLLTVMDGLQGGRFSFSPKHKQVILVTCEYIKEILKRKKDGHPFSIEHILETFQGIASEEPTDINKSYIKDIINNSNSRSIKSGEITLDKSKEVNVTLRKIDNMITSINELILNQYQLKTTIDRIVSIDVDSKYRRLFKEISNSVKNQTLKIELGANNLQEEILSLRMLPISIIHSGIKEAIANKIKQTGKKVELDLHDSQILIDKLILQNIQSPIISIIENSINHGILESGKIDVEYLEENGKIFVDISDNGKGIDFRKIRSSSIEVFPHDKENIIELSDNELIEYMFMEGISSRKSLKGQGLSSALECVKNVKGTINIVSYSQNGVKIRIAVPKSLTTITGYFIVSGGEKFFVPSSYISEIIRIDREVVLDLVTRQAVKLRDEIVPIYPLSGILDGKVPKNMGKLFIIICKLENESLGIVVDEILYHSSAIYKRLPANIEGLSPIQGVVFDEEFNIVNILYIPKIADSLKSIRNIEFNTRYQKDSIDYKKILIIDDSNINRDIVKNMFIRSGFSVELATDGIDALQKAKDTYFNLIITDSHMPKMDGQTFIENIKKEEIYKNTPIIVLSSSNSRIEIDKFIGIGASSVYLKSNFNRDTLLNDVNILLGSANV